MGRYCVDQADSYRFVLMDSQIEKMSMSIAMWSKRENHTSMWMKKLMSGLCYQ